MNTSELLREWALTRRRQEAWQAMFTEDPQQAAIACCVALAAPQSPREMFAALLVDGEFELAELLLLDEQTCAELGADTIAALTGQVESARREALAALEVHLAPLMNRADRTGVDIDGAAIRRVAEVRRAAALTALAAAEAEVQGAEARQVLRLRERLAHAPEGYVDWRLAVERAIDFGAIEEAAGMLDAGPSVERPPSFTVPSGPLWPFGEHRLVELLDWFRESEPAPAWFSRIVPPRDGTNDVAWRLIDGVAAWCGARGEREREHLLRAFAAVMECRVLGSAFKDGYGRVIRIEAASAPGFHAFAARRWPDGLTVGLADEVLLVFVGEHVIELSLRDVLATVAAADRRAHLLAALGRQLPLAAAFVSTLADEGVRWERHDLPRDLLTRERIVVLVSAPGMGKTTLLRELAALHPGAKLVDASPGVELPEASALLIDAADVLDVAALRSLLLEAQWARTTRHPQPAVLIAGRPELVARLAVPPGTMEVARLPSRSAVSMREQARVTLAWVGVDATRPGLYDRMAWLASGNPTLLFLLCRAAAVVLAARGPTVRRLDEDVLDRAWTSDEFVRSARRLLFDPLQATPQAQSVLRTITELARPHETIDRDTLLWAMREAEPARDRAWLDGHLRLLEDYGLLQTRDVGVRLSAGGITQLVYRWCDETSA